MGESMTSSPTSRLACVVLGWLAGTCLASASAQQIAAPSDARNASDATIRFPIQPGGVLADAALVRRLGEFELDPPVVSRGTNAGSRLEALFASRCRAVVLVAAQSGKGEREQSGTGTGSVIDSFGFVLTAAHVVAGADKVAIGVFPNCEPGTQPQVYAASVVRVDEIADLALLRFDRTPKDLTTIPLGQLGAVRPGSSVVIIGHPRGLLMSMSQGVVSAIRPDFVFSNENAPQQKATVIQTDGALNPGNSGGPMMSADGSLIGVNSFIYRTSPGLNFAIAVSDVRTFLGRGESRRFPRQDVKAKPEECKPKTLKEWREDDGEQALLDIGCAGKANARLIVPDDVRRRATLLWDRNGDGNADARYYLDRNFRPEYSEWDDDYDGKYDYRAEHEGGDWEPKEKTRMARR
jgi:S1-C subfamily serine protease